MSSETNGRKRGREINHTDNDPRHQRQEPLELPQALGELSVEAMFHPKFDNERRTDQSIRQDIQQRILQNQGYVEVTLKHSGSLVLWSGYDRYYSKNDTANVFTSAAEILLRQHFYRAWNQDSAETQYQECSQFLEDQGSTLAFEVVTAVLGDHGDIPNRDFVLLTAIADKRQERFLSPLELIQVAQRFRLPFNDTWVFASPESVHGLFQLYDTSRETGMAQDTVAALTASGNVQHVPSMYPHHVFQGDILEGFIIRYIPYPKDEQLSSTHIQDTLHTLTVGAQDILTWVPPALPPSFQMKDDSGKKPPQLFRTDIRTIYKETHGHLREGRDKFAQALQDVLVHSEDYGRPRRTIRRIPSRTVDIPSLTKALLVESKDPETRRIAEMIQTVADFKGVVYQVVQEVYTSKDDHRDVVRWLCIIHVLYDQIFQKFQQRKRPGAMPLFRGFCLELKSADDIDTSTSTVDDNGVVDMDIDSPVKYTDRGEETTGELMLKMKFLPYMVRTFICRNNLRVVQQEGPEAFTYAATKLMDRWEVSMAAKQKWIPFFQQWGIYAQSCQRNGNSEPGLPPLAESSYLAHLDHFIKLYENGELPTTSSPESSFQGVAFVVALQKETAEQVANVLAKQLGGAKVRNASNVAHTSPSLGGIVFFAGIADANKAVRQYLSAVAGHSAVVMLCGCSDNDIHQEFEQTRDQKKHVGLRKFWMNIKCGAVISIPKAASLAVEDLPEFQDAVTKIEVLNKTAPEICLNKKKRPGPGFLVYFPGIPGCGKSTLTGKNVREELQRRLADAEGAKEGEPPVVERNVIILQGDEVQGKKFWPTAKIEREADPSCLFIADKNAPATAWSVIGNYCAETSGYPIAALPDKTALQTTSLQGAWTPDSSVIPDTTHCYPFSLPYLAVCMARVLERRPSSHAGKLDSGTPNACMIVIKFFSLYRGLSAEDFKDILQRKMQKAGVLEPPQKAIKLPFFARETQLPHDLQTVLTESLQLQFGYDLSKTKVKADDNNSQRMESRLRECLASHRGMLLNSTIREGDSQAEFVSQIIDRVTTFNARNKDGEAAGNGTRPSKEPETFVKIASIDVEMAAVHTLLMQYKDSATMEFLNVALAGKSLSNSFQGGIFAGKDFVSTTHLTMAHIERTSQATIRQLYGGLLGARVELKVTALLWSTRVAAFAVNVAEQTEDGKKLSKSQNSFSHITIWFRGTTAFEANQLPDLVESGEAQRIEFDNPIPLSGKISFWGKDNQPLRNS